MSYMDYLTAIFSWIGKFLQNNLHITVSALAGTFLGAYLAFFFERRHSDKKERAMNISAAKRAQFVIQAQLNAVKNIKNQVLDSLRDDPQRHLTLKPFSVLAKFPTLDLNSLMFMLESDDAQLLNELMISEHKYSTLIGALDQRNARHEKMQQKMAEVRPQNALNNATLTILKDMTDSIYGLCDDALSSLEESFQKLQSYIEREFPGVRALRVEWKY
jgi:uncharacterized protein (DUF1778 family)